MVGATRVWRSARVEASMAAEGKYSVGEMWAEARVLVAGSCWAQRVAQRENAAEAYRGIRSLRFVSVVAEDCLAADRLEGLSMAHFTNGGAPLDWKLTLGGVFGRETLRLCDAARRLLLRLP